MSKFIICGAGPIGLYTAISLVKLGIDSKNITIVDPRAGSYYRSGKIDFSLFTEISKSIGHEIKASDSRHIKDLERQLYLVATQLNIQFEKMNFVDFKTSNEMRKMVVVSNNATTLELPADYVLDCTGNKRAAVLMANKALGVDHFKIIQASSSPIENHIFAYVHAKTEDVRSLNVDFEQYGAPIKGITDPIEFFKSMKILEGLGWSMHVPPDVRVITLNKNKMLFFTECPEKIKEDNYDGWVQAVLRMYQEDKYAKPIQYTKIMGKNNVKKTNFIKFKVSPKMLNQFTCVNENIPTVAALGDAQIEPDFRFGHGISSGKKRSDLFISCLKVKDNVVYFDDKNYEKLVSKVISNHKEQLDWFYDYKRKEILEFEPVYKKIENIYNLSPHYKEKVVNNSYLFKKSEYDLLLEKSENHVLKNPGDQPYLIAIKEKKFDTALRLSCLNNRPYLTELILNYKQNNDSNDNFDINSKSSKGESAFDLINRSKNYENEDSKIKMLNLLENFCKNKGIILNKNLSTMGSDFSSLKIA